MDIGGLLGMFTLMSITVIVVRWDVFLVAVLGFIAIIQEVIFVFLLEYFRIFEI